MRILDSRRLTGPSLLLDRPGAILEVGLQGIDAQRAITAWHAELRPLLDAFGWSDARDAARAHAQGVSLTVEAPIDVLYAATEVNEAAWHAAARALGGGETDGLDGDGDAADDRDAAIARLREAIERERRPWLLELADEAHRHGVTLLADDRRVSVGFGAGSRVWPLEETQQVMSRIPWSEVRDIPCALVTGTNGKSTTVRLLGSIAAAAGQVAGITSTDHVTVGEEVVAEGDYSGPNGARTVLRDRRVQVAVLELARGGILRRGLAVPSAQVALVTNVANDHLGEFGIFDVAALADAKMVVAKAVGPEGRVVLNADDPLLVERGLGLHVPVTWFTLDASDPMVKGHLARGGEACLLSGDTLVLARGTERHTVARVQDVPLTFDGAARHNIANALAAIGVARSLGMDFEAIRSGLTSFESSPSHNPGRGNVWRLGDVTAIVDFAHNPHGLDALAAMTAALPARRRALVIGQAGDRDDDAIRAFARSAWAMRPDRVFIKEMTPYLRGRSLGVIPEMIERELRRLGAEAQTLERHDTELDAVIAALRWAHPGDLLLLTTHAQRDEVLALMERLAAAAWKPGEPLGETPLDVRIQGS